MGTSAARARQIRLQRRRRAKNNVEPDDIEEEESFSEDKSDAKGEPEAETEGEAVRLTVQELYKREMEAKSRVKSNWENLLLRLSRYSEEDQGDVLDLTTLEIVEDKGHVKSLEEKTSSDIWHEDYDDLKEINSSNYKAKKLLQKRLRYANMKDDLMILSPRSESSSNRLRAKVLKNLHESSKGDQNNESEPSDPLALSRAAVLRRLISQRVRNQSPVKETRNIKFTGPSNGESSVNEIQTEVDLSQSPITRNIPPYQDYRVEESWEPQLHALNRDREALWNELLASNSNMLVQTEVTPLISDLSESEAESVTDPKLFSTERPLENSIVDIVSGVDSMKIYSNSTSPVRRLSGSNNVLLNHPNKTLDNRPTEMDNAHQDSDDNESFYTTTESVFSEESDIEVIEIESDTVSESVDGRRTVSVEALEVRESTEDLSYETEPREMDSLFTESKSRVAEADSGARKLRSSDAEMTSKELEAEMKSMNLNLGPNKMNTKASKSDSRASEKDDEPLKQITSSKITDKSFLLNREKLLASRRPLDVYTITKEMNTKVVEQDTDAVELNTDIVVIDRATAELSLQSEEMDTAVRLKTESGVIAKRGNDLGTKGRPMVIEDDESEDDESEERSHATEPEMIRRAPSINIRESTRHRWNDESFDDIMKKLSRVDPSTKIVTPPRKDYKLNNYTRSPSTRLFQISPSGSRKRLSLKFFPPETPLRKKPSPVKQLSKESQFLFNR